MRCVVLLSGGLDSATLLAVVRERTQEVACLSVNYGQKHCKELECARKLAQWYQVEHRILDLSSLAELLNSALIDPQTPVPYGYYTEQNMAATVVPGRNTVLLSLAASWAVSKDYDTVAYAAHSGDHAIYPDCRPKYIEAMQRVLSLFHYRPLVLYAPFAGLTKGQIVKLGLSLRDPVPYHLTWTCYEGQEQACGLCGACQERLEAFAYAAAKDPLQYRQKVPNRRG